LTASSKNALKIPGDIENFLARHVTLEIDSMISFYVLFHPGNATE
jgi:hypothetical protein